jgi:phosphate starvation-inducible PhoH-like protein
LKSISRNIEISGINPAEFFGVNNANFRHLKSFFPQLKITARGNVISLNGEEEILDEFERKLDLLVQHFDKFNFLSENSIDNLMLVDSWNGRNKNKSENCKSEKTSSGCQSK